MTDEQNVQSSPQATESFLTSDRFTGVAVALLMALAFILVGRRAFVVATGPLPPSKGVAAPAFSVAGIDGADIKLADHRGQVVLLDFWATWCPPCVASMPSLQKLYDRHKAAGLVVIGVNQEPGSPGRVRRFLRQYKLTFPNLLDPGDIAKTYGVYSFPTSVVIGRDGIVRKMYRGPAPEAELERLVEALLAEPDKRASL